MNRIRELRTAAHVSSGALAVALGVNPKAIWSWENEVSEIKQSNLIRLADFFEVSIDYILGRENEAGIITSSTNLSPLENTLVSIAKRLTKDNLNRVIGYARAVADEQYIN